MHIWIDWKELFPPRARAPRQARAPEADPEQDELDLFSDQTHERGVSGFYAEDAAECASRRIDLRGPTDRDPGPLPMEEASDEVEAIRLSFA